ncbi:hypothetical protein FA13DRAFT_1645685 [Coprinellus micaceus]|uniref:DUF6593 domain-containing protein n=1 Tax=Coprinellus micaceus TaxID=71717 RepID=A0A4Y7SEC7_COPMI|nr:hypothetical protein FA13DRAFT_1645685 [Coprinellus micaceus]
MQLVLSTGDPYNAVYTTTEGRVLYKVVSRSRKLPPRRWSTVDKAVPAKSSTGDKQDHFKRIGEVEFHTILSSVITFRGVTQDVDTYFRKGSSTLPLTLGSHRIFVGPDGKEYRWKLAHTKPVLYRHSDKARVAKFLPQDTTVASNSRRAMLEIYSAGEHMVDTIVVTLAYIEKLRQDRESVLSL